MRRDGGGCHFFRMTHTLFHPDALTRSVPRYTSYPTAPHFGKEVDGDAYARWLGTLGPETTLSLYLHIPFCDQLCFFCACRTQGSRNHAPVERYLGFLLREIEMVAGHVGNGHRVGQLHWGGGSPTILNPQETLRLKREIVAAFPGAATAAFDVEIDPRDMTDSRLDALAEAGLTRASIGVQDFDPAVQAAIGRHQGHRMTRGVIEGLRQRGVGSINVDLVYGLPAQSDATLGETIRKVIDIAPERLALFGYAHVPWMARRQKVIDERLLPGPAARRTQARVARELLLDAGYVPVGIDHFAKPGDSLAVAAAEGRLRRNFQGYTTDRADALIGMGASAIGRLPQGYAQNDPSTAGYQARIEAGQLPVVKGRALGLDDRVRADAIEQLLCDFRIDVAGLLKRYGDFAQPVAERAAELAREAPEGAILSHPWGFEIGEAWHDYTRLVAAEFDAYLGAAPARHSIAL
jgi:oxygen-independent coproporphyrinogen-3 oxidase